MKKVFSFLLTNKKKISWLLVGVLAVLVVSQATFSLLKWYNNTYKVSETTSAFRIELPQGISKKDLGSLTNEQRKTINDHIAGVLKVETERITAIREVIRPVAVILTQNNRPILPDLKQPEVGGQAPTASPTLAVLTPAPTVTFTLTPTPTIHLISPSPRVTSIPTLTSAPIITPTPTKPPDAVEKDEDDEYIPSPAREDYQLRFSISDDVKEAYWDKRRFDLANDVERIYQEARKIYGPPFRDLDVSIVLSSGLGLYYNISLNSIVFDPNQIPTRQDLIWMILQAFHDELVNYMPQNWEEGMREVATQEIYRNVFDSSYFDEQLNLPFWELIDGYGLANKNGDLYADDRFTDVDYYALAVTTLYKPYLEDNQFIANFNRALYQERLDNTLKDQLINLAISLIDIVNGELSAGFFQNHFILRVHSLPGWILNAEKYNDQVIFSGRATTGGYDENKKVVAGTEITFQLRDMEQSQIFRKTLVTDNDGVVQLGPLPSLADVNSNYDNYTGAVEISIFSDGHGGSSFFYPYFYGKPVVPGGEAGSGLFGAVRYTKTGKIEASFGPTVSKPLDQGAFTFAGPGNYRGKVELKYSDEEEGVFETKSVMKNQGPYYTEFKKPSQPLSLPPSTGARGGSAPEAGADCAVDWQEFVNEKYGLKFKHPSDWSFRMPPSNNLFRRNPLATMFLASVTELAPLLDSMAKHSFFDILASKTDIKNDPEYGRWFDNLSGLGETSQSEFKGMSAEKYLEETEMPAGAHRKEMYYFKKDDIYYLISFVYYITDDVKDENVEMKKCFIDSLELFEPVEKGKGKLIQCTAGQFSTAAEIAENPLSDLPLGKCSQITNDFVCGHVRHIDENGEEKTYGMEKWDACVYCAFFDENGYREWRDAKYYSLGYEKGICN